MRMISPSIEHPSRGLCLDEFVEEVNKVEDGALVASGELAVGPVDELHAVLLLVAGEFVVVAAFSKLAHR